MWSYLLAAVGIAGLLLAGSKRKLGWAVGFGAQGLWIAYAVATEQYGFIAAALAYATVYARNWLKWRAEERAPRVPFVEEPPLTYEPGLVRVPGVGIAVPREQVFDMREER